MSRYPPDTAALLSSDEHARRRTHEVWSWLREHDPVHWHEAGDYPGFWSVTRYEDVRAVYRTPEVYSSRFGVLLRPASSGIDPGGGSTLALTDDPRHRELRRVLAPRFDQRSARAMAPVLKRDIDNAIERAQARQECDLVHDLGSRLSSLSIARLVGIADEDIDRFVEWAARSFDTGTSIATNVELMEFLSSLMYERMVSHVEDVMGRLTNEPIDDALLSEEEVLLNCENIIGASENAGLSLAVGLVTLAQHPQSWTRLRERPDLIPSAVEEILRWSSSATHSMRVTTRPTDLHGVRIPAGDRVVVWLPSANRDVSVFSDPTVFDITRKPNRHLALGDGPHVCIGGTMARTQMRLLLQGLLENVERVELLQEPTPLASIAVGGYASAPAVLVPA